ncbi:hypothetical protein [Leptolyngbya ohadii]|nr:hypothetical protein [Leptolyngbya ohadii]
MASWLLYQLSVIVMIHGLWLPLVPSALTLLTIAGLVVVYRAVR